MSSRRDKSIRRAARKARTLILVQARESTKDRPFRERYDVALDFCPEIRLILWPGLALVVVLLVAVASLTGQVDRFAGQMDDLLPMPGAHGTVSAETPPSPSAVPWADTTSADTATTGQLD